MPLDPHKEFFTRDEVLIVLGNMTADTFASFVRAGWFPVGEVLKLHAKEKSKRHWSRDEVEWMVWRLKNRRNFIVPKAKKRHAESEKRPVE